MDVTASAGSTFQGVIVNPGDFLDLHAGCPQPLAQLRGFDEAIILMGTPGYDPGYVLATEDGDGKRCRVPVQCTHKQMATRYQHVGAGGNH
jgi:hypothetical protein